MKTIEEQIKCVKREIAMRKRVYPKWVKYNRMKQEEADHEITCMESVLKTMEGLSNQTSLFE